METWRWRGAFLAVACLICALLTLGGWRLVEQERSLRRERMRERLENAASLVVRESERALAQMPDDGMLAVEWKDGTMRRSGGVGLAWSESPPEWKEAAPGIFREGEWMEFGAEGPERALAVYEGLEKSADAAVRAGAALRIARCHRKLGRSREVRAAYERLAALGPAHVAGAPAELIALRELGEKERLRKALEEGRYVLDRTTFEFLADGLEINARVRGWAEAAGRLWKRSQEFARGAEVMETGGRKYAADWSPGRGRLVDMEALERQVGRSIGLGGIEWQLDGGKAGGFRRRAGETGLPFDIRVEAAEGEADGSLLHGGLALSGSLLAAALGLAYAAVARQVKVARMQSEFVAAVSHELRTPVTALTHLMEMLETGGAPPERLPAYYKALRKETERLREMVESVLDFGRMESGRYKHKPERFDLVDFVRELVEEFREAPAASGHEVVFAAGRDRYVVMADRATLRRAVWNLLDNAAKYSPEGKRVVARVEAEGGRAEVSVEDEGPGIEAGQRRAIFEKFVRGPEAVKAGVKGTGIGLAMVEAITRAHGGHVELWSRPGEGSRFTIVLPEEASR